MSNAARISLFRKPLCRLAVTKAAARQAVTPPEVQHTKLINGITVTSIENYAPVSRFAVSAKAGSRYETESNRGASHVLRVMTGMRTDDTTAVTLTRHLQQLGATLTCTVDRDVVCYQLKCLRDLVPEALQYLKEVSLLPLFRQWELNDNTWRLTRDLEALKRSPGVMLVERLHEAAFKSGLSHSLYCPEHMVGRHTSQMMNDYVKQNFTAGRMAVTGAGINHEDLVGFAGSLPTDAGSTSTETPAFRGGDVRFNTGGNTAYAAVGVQRPGLDNMKDCFALAVLEYIMGSGPRIKYGSGAATRLGAAAARAVPNAATTVSAINLGYQDTGIFGFAASVSSQHATQVLKAVADEIKTITSGQVTAAEVAAAKTKVLTGVFSMYGDDILQEMLIQILGLKEAVTFQDAVEGVNAVTIQDVTAVAKKVFGSKPCIAAVGDVSNVPYLDQL